MEGSWREKKKELKGRKRKTSSTPSKPLLTPRLLLFQETPRNQVTEDDGKPSSSFLPLLSSSDVNDDSVNLPEVFRLFSLSTFRSSFFSSSSSSVFCLLLLAFFRGCPPHLVSRLRPSSFRVSPYFCPFQSKMPPKPDPKFAIFPSFPFDFPRLLDD